MLVLRVLRGGSLHGYAIAQRPAGCRIPCWRRRKARSTRLCSACCWKAGSKPGGDLGDQTARTIYELTPEGRKKLKRELAVQAGHRRDPCHPADGLRGN